MLQYQRWRKEHVLPFFDPFYHIPETINRRDIDPSLLDTRPVASDPAAVRINSLDLARIKDCKQRFTFFFYQKVRIRFSVQTIGTALMIVWSNVVFARGLKGFVTVFSMHGCCVKCYYCYFYSSVLEVWLCNFQCRKKINASSQVVVYILPNTFLTSFIRHVGEKKFKIKCHYHPKKNA